MGTVDRIGNKPLWVVPLGVKALLSQRGITNCIELDWWESHVITSPNPEDNIEIIFTPTKHWTSRTLFDKNTCLWGSYVVKSSQSKFFFTGDTAYCDIFKTIGELYGPFDLSAIPIGAYKPRWFMSQVHCDPFEAVKIHQDLQSKQSTAIHWATYPLADEDFAEPALELARCRDELNVQSNEFFTTIPGETYSLSDEIEIPLGVKALLSQRGITNCIELDWWESHVITSPNPEDNIEIIFTPTKHWTSRTLFDKNTCLWGSYVVKSSQSKFFFTGDTAYCDIFKTIGELYGPFDLSAIPIGAYKPRWFMSQVHCDPFEAVKIHQDLQSKQSTAIHWATYPLADEDFAEPALELARCRDELNVQSNEFFTTIPGETYSLSDEVTNDFAKLRPILYDAYKKYYIAVKD
eukprot:gene18731-24495_t